MNEPTRIEILDAGELLAGDGAYEAVDAPVAKAIVRANVKTDCQIHMLWSVIGKYQARLAELGTAYESLVPPTPGNGVLVAGVRFAWSDTSRGRRIGVLFQPDPKTEEVLKAVRRSPKSPPWEGHNGWIIPEDFDLLESLMTALRKADLAFRLDPAVAKGRDEARQVKAQAYEASRAEESSIDVPTKLELYPFQKAGVGYIEDQGGRALVADEMGLGKTVQALGYLARHQEVLPALVICPSTLRATWYKEILRFTPFKPLILSSKTSLRAFQNLGLNAALMPEAGYDVVIMNYDLFETQTVQLWIRAFCKKDKSAEAYLIEAGQYALKQLRKAYEKSKDIEATQRLLALIGKIEKQRGSNRRRFVKVLVNGYPLADFMTHGFRSLVCDEIHYLKDMKAQRTLAVAEISRAVQSVVGLTGTPVLNRPKELWSQIYIINPRIFPDFMKYGVRFCDGHKEEIKMKGSPQGTKQEVWNFSGASNLEELDRELRTKVMIRRLKKEVLKELPEKVRVTIPIVIEKGMEGYRKGARPALARLAKIKKERDEWKTQMAALEPEARAAYLAEHAEEKATKNALTGIAIKEIEGLKLLAVKAKFGQAVKFVLDAHDQQGKIVLFMIHHETIDQMVMELEGAGLKVGRIDGRVAGADREPIKEAFQDGDTDILVCGIRAASEGLTLTASHTVIFVEFDWNPSRHDQAEARVDRIGQTVSPTVYYLMTMGTIEEKIVALIDAKRELVHASLGEGDRTVEEGGILDSVLDEILEAA